MQIIIRSSLIAKNASGISGSIVSLPLRSARLNRPSDLENRFIVTRDYCPHGSCGYLVVKSILSDPLKINLTLLDICVKLLRSMCIVYDILPVGRRHRFNYQLPHKVTTI